MTKDGPVGNKSAPFPHSSHELRAEDEKRLESLFKQLDVNRDGRIDANDLSEALHRMGIHQMPGHVQVSWLGRVTWYLPFFIEKIYISVVCIRYLLSELKRV